MDKNVIVEMTPFIFEDGNTYYFQILKRSTSFHDLFVYKKEKRRNFWLKSYDEMVCLNEDDPKLVNIPVSTINVKSLIFDVLKSIEEAKLVGWDGFVGNISDEVKKSLIRESKLDNILDK